MRGPTPSARRLAMPPEFGPHERMLVAWPARPSLWGAHLAVAKEAYRATVLAVAEFEPVTVVARPGDGREAARACADGTRFGVEVVELPIDDSWVRDTGPLVVTGPDGRRVGVDFAFNGWGRKFEPFAADAALGAALCAHLGIERVAAPLVLEGGSVTVDGAGTLVTTEQCLLHPSRNPGLGRDEIEAALRALLGVDRVVWLRAGLVEDTHTDGHVDNVCSFVDERVALVQGVDDPADPNATQLAENRARLEAAGIRTIPLDLLPSDHVGGTRVVVPPVNCVLTNGGVVVPVPDGDPATAAAVVARLAAALPDRRVVAVPGSVLALGGGGAHCITLQVPRARASAR